MMTGLGTGINGELTFIDIISIVSFLVGVQNLDLNITQEDVQNVASAFDKRMEEAISDIHEHLSVQDTKLNIILNKLEVMENGS